MLNDMHVSQIQLAVLVTTGKSAAVAICLAGASTARYCVLRSACSVLLGLPLG